MADFTDDVEFDSIDETPELRPARFVTDLDLPSADCSLLSDARKAVREEFRGCSRWIRLSCRKVSVFAESGRGIVYAIHVGGGVEFDWTWEGATAFRPHVMGNEDRIDIDLADFEESPVDEASIWSGEILEVDEQSGCLFVSLAESGHPPLVGWFLVRPFDFLGTLNSVFNGERFQPLHEDLTRRLAATLGGIHPRIERSSSAGLTELGEWWQHAWSVLWGPPGTGKTYTTGRQLAAVLSDKSERILVVSTTNRATDAVAVSLGAAARELSPSSLNGMELLRIGKGASPETFARAHLLEMLAGTETKTLDDIAELMRQLPLIDSWEEKAFARKRIGELREGLVDQSRHLFAHSEVRVVVATAFKALQLLDQDMILSLLERGEAPFTTVVIDESGLISRAATAVLSLLASRRVVLVGDSKQLAPISRVCRVLPSRQKIWLAHSGLSHLDQLTSVPSAVHVLTEQRRMHPDISRVVSDYQYRSILTTAPEVAFRSKTLPPLLADQPRAIWYVLDEEGKNLASIRAERGPGNRSWIRTATRDVLAKLFRDPGVATCRGLFIAPYVAQARDIADWLATNGFECWEASTVHSQQGAEADLVVFDTVNAGSCQWPHDEWKRLVNVALSRAREAVIVLASRHEMDEPYLRPLLAALSPRVLVSKKNGVFWRAVDGPSSPLEKDEPLPNEETLGGQFARRKAMKPILSQEQQRLSNLELDGKPRLVRGVAGSGKTVVLSNWLVKTVGRHYGDPDVKVLAVYANQSLHKLLQASIEAAWKEGGHLFEFPWEQVELEHIQNLLARLLPRVGLSMHDFDFKYDEAAEVYLNRTDESEIEPCCRALFIDEAQDLGPNALRLLLSLVEKSDPHDWNSRSAHIFFDNAQNVYGRKTPKWSDFGLDMRGRSTVMKESFRSTKPIMELAVNVLHRLAPASDLQDHKELLSLGLITKCQRQGEDWLSVEFNQVDGPVPYVRQFSNRESEMRSLAKDLERLLTKEKVSASNICLIYNSGWVPQRLMDDLSPRLNKIGVELSVQTSGKFERRDNTLLITTANSFKGYDAEIVLIPCADNYYAGQGGKVLASSLYVAMTRARSILGVYSTENHDPAATRLNETLFRCGHLLKSPPRLSARDELADIIEQTEDK